MIILDPSLYWQQSNDQELIDAVNEYWKREPNLTEQQITVLRSYLVRWISGSTDDYPKKKEHLTKAEACQNIEDIKNLTISLIDWGVDPW